MTNRWKYHLLGLSYLLMTGILAPSPTLSQFVDLQLDIAPRITAITERPLDFGTVTTDTEKAVISLGDTGMGVFSITGLKNHQIAVSLSIPNYLIHQDPSVTARVPADIQTRYGFTRNQPENTIIITDKISSLNIPETDTANPWGKVYIFMYGTLETRDIPEGIYSSDILLQVEYL